MEFNYTALESVVSGEPAHAAVPRLAERLQAERVFLVASKSLATATNDFSELQKNLGGRLAGMSTEIRAHTPREDVLAVLGDARRAKADLLVALGGGSVIDASKAIQLALSLELNSAEELLQYAQRADGSRGAKAGELELFSKRSKIRQIAVPTTLSGAEFSNNAGVLDTENNAKEGYRAAGLCPQIIVYDAALTIHTPQWLFLSTAIRSLDHAIEGFCSSASTPFLDGHFLHAMRLFKQALPQCQLKPQELAPRALVQQAVWLACCGLGSVPHGASHGIGYILGSLCGVPHGYTSCVMLPAVLQWNSSVLQHKQALIAEALGMPGHTAAEAVKQLVQELGLPSSLQEVEVSKDRLDQIAERAILHPVVKNNPKALSTAAQVREILELACRVE